MLRLWVLGLTVFVGMFGCAPEERLSSVSTSPAPSAAPRAAGADPLCGEKWRWDGSHCAPLEGTAAEGSAPQSAQSEEKRSRSSRTAGEASGPEDSPAKGTSSQLGITDLIVGKGAEAKSGDNVRIHYVGTLADGSEFDSSRKRNMPFEFKLGTGMVIKGFDRGVTGMKVGGKRKLTVPPGLGYGRKGAPPVIPPNATLTFEIELLDVL